MLHNNLAWNGQDPCYRTQTIWVDTQGPLRWGVEASHTLPVRVSELEELRASSDLTVPQAGSFNAIIQLYTSPAREKAYSSNSFRASGAGRLVNSWRSIMLAAP